MSGPLKVLLVDDSMSMRMLAKNIVSELGHDVIGEASDGKDAVQQYLELQPDVVLLDLVMPEYDGRAALNKIMSIDDNAQVVICSSLGSEQDVETCLRNGARSYLQKPLEASTVGATLSTLSALN
ncbi:MAG: response regulator [Pseudomonadota bacterium]